MPSIPALALALALALAFAFAPATLPPEGYDPQINPARHAIELDAVALAAQCYQDDDLDLDACAMADLLQACLAGETDFCWTGDYWTGE